MPDHVETLRIPYHSFFQNVLTQGQTEEFPLQDLLLVLGEDLALDFSLSPVRFGHLGPGRQAFPRGDRPRQTWEERRTTKGSLTATMAA